MKIYIIPCGWDRELVIKTVFKSGADKVCLVSAYPKKSHTYSQTDLITKKVNEFIKEELSKFTTVDVIEVNYIDLKDIVLQLNKYIRENQGAEFVVNIATGSRMVAASLLFVACMNNISVEYSIAKNHNPDIMKIIEQGEDYHCGFSEILKVPTIPFSVKFSQKEKALLQRLKKDNRLSVKEFVAGATGNNENRMRSEFHYLCKKLEKQGFVQIKNTGKKFEISLTHFGELFIDV